MKIIPVQPNLDTRTRPARRSAADDLEFGRRSHRATDHRAIAASLRPSRRSFGLRHFH